MGIFGIGFTDRLVFIILFRILPDGGHGVLKIIMNPLVVKFL
jgi:hypothetical protein